MKKTIFKGLALASMAAMFASCAESVVADFQVPAPDGAVELEELYSYKPIKEYIDRGTYPNFKLSTAINILEFTEGGFVRAVAPTNFDEIMLVDGMMMGSTVKTDGSTNYKNLSDLLDGVDRSEISLFGNALAANTTQPTAYLNTVIADVKSDELATDCDIDFSEYTGDLFPEIGGFRATIVDGILTSVYPKKKYSFYISPVFEAQVGNQYEIVFECKGELKEKIGCAFGETEKQFTPDTDWTEYTYKLYATNPEEGVIINAGRYKGTLEFRNMRITHYPLIQQTPEEKIANLSEALGTWYASMMEECANKVTSWNIIAEPLNAAADEEGGYSLKHNTGKDGEFYWQDYFTDEKYGAIVSQLARDKWSANGGKAEDLKLFVDEDLSSDFDNTKLDALLGWVKTWESNGAKIDGIGCQLHICYSENEEWQRIRADHYVTLLRKLVETGKIVRISALDMGYQDIKVKEITSNGISTSALIDAQYQNMANFYRFIIQMYLKIVPSAQQDAICQRCLCDGEYAWRKSEPVGLWSKGWQRKAAYVAFCEALDTKNNPIPDTQDYFDYINKLGLSHYVTPLEVDPTE